MPHRNELAALASARPTVLDRAGDVVSSADEEQLLDRILETSPGRAVEVTRGHTTRPRVRVGALVGALAAVALVAGVLVSAAGPSTTTRGWHLVGDLTSSTFEDVSPLAVTASSSLACPGTSTCYADVPLAGTPKGEAGWFDAIEVTTDGGATWTSSSLGVTVAGASEISCWSSEQCLQVGRDASGAPLVLATTDGGTTWSSSPGPSGLTATFGELDLSCATTDTCVAVASDPADPAASSLAFSTTDAGATWTESSVGASFAASSLQCSAAGACALVGHAVTSTTSTGLAFVSEDGGASWSPSSLPAGTGQLFGLACSGSTCWSSTLVGDASTSVLSSSDAGRSWSAAPTSGLPAGLALGLACPTGTSCEAAGLTGATVSSEAGSLPSITPGAGASGYVASSADGGQTWQEGQLPDGVLLVADLTCPDAASCFALGAVGTPSGTIRLALLASAGSGGAG